MFMVDVYAWCLHMSSHYAVYSYKCDTVRGTNDYRRAWNYNATDCSNDGERFVAGTEFLSLYLFHEILLFLIPVFNYIGYCIL